VNRLTAVLESYGHNNMFCVFHVRSEVLTAANMKIIAFNNAIPPSFFDSYNRFRGLAYRRSNLLYDWRVSQSVSMSWCRAGSGTCDQILLPVGILLSESCGLVSVGRPLWREDGSAICSVITQWSESLRTRNHPLLSHLILPQPGRPGSRIYIPQELGCPVKPPGTGLGLGYVFHLQRRIRRWR
jgi:hypothetical protein